MGSAPGPLAGTAGYRLWHVDGHDAVGRVRAQCCLGYRCEAASYCFSCPLEDEAHRRAILLARHAAVDRRATVGTAA